MTKQQSKLTRNDWLWIGIPLIIGAVLILVTTQLLGWMAEPASPWGKVIANFFYQNPLAALIPLLIGIFALVKAIRMS